MNIFSPLFVTIKAVHRKRCIAFIVNPKFLACMKFRVALAASVFKSIACDAFLVILRNFIKNVSVFDFCGTIFEKILYSMI